MENNKLKKTEKTVGFNKANSTSSGFKSEPFQQVKNASSKQSSVLEKKISLTNKKKLIFSSAARASAALQPSTAQQYSEIKNRLKKKPRLGEICNLNLTAIGPNKIAVDENSYSCPIITSHLELGKVKAKIVKIISKEGKPVMSGETPKYAIATTLTEKNLQSEQQSSLNISSKGSGDKIKQFSGVIPGEVCEVTINKISSKGSGIVDFSNNYKLIIPVVSKEIKTGQKVKIAVTRVKRNYAFGKLLEPLSTSVLPSKSIQDVAFQTKNSDGRLPNQKQDFLKGTLGGFGFPSTESSARPTQKVDQVSSIKLVGSKYTLTLPKKCKKYGNFIVLNLQNSTLFVKLALGSKLGDKVRVKLTKVMPAYSIGKIIQINPTSAKKKQLIIRQVLGQMIKHGLHFGEKAVKCHARMKNFIWLKKPNVGGQERRNTLGLSTFSSRSKLDLASYPSNSLGWSAYGNSLGSRPVSLDISLPKLVTSSSKNSVVRNEKRDPKVIERRSALETKYSQNTRSAGANTAINGLTASKATPPSKSNTTRPLIKKGRHVINLLKTHRCLNQTLSKLTKYALKGRSFLFIGTKKPVAGLISRASFFSKNSFFVNTRWLGGMLTNWKTILKSIKKIKPILKEKQIIVRDLLKKRQTIKSRLVKKALLVRKKSQLIVKKGQLLIQHFKKYSVNTEAGPYSLENVKKFALKRQELIDSSKKLLEKNKKLLTYRKKLIMESELLKEKGSKIVARYRFFVNKFLTCRKKLRELKYIWILSKEIQSLKLKSNEQNKNLVSVSYAKLKQLKQNVSAGLQSSSAANAAGSYLLPNPPKEILNRILLTLNLLPTSGEVSRDTAASVGSEKKNNSNFLAKSNVPLRGDSPQSEANNHNKKIIILTKLLTQLGRFEPYVKLSITNLKIYLTKVEEICLKHYNELQNIKKILNTVFSFKTKVNNQILQIKTKLKAKRNIIRLIKKKLKQLLAQKKLLSLLPKLKYLKTPQNKILQTVEILMKKFVDPQIKFSMDQIYEQKLKGNSKKVAAIRKQKWQRLEKYLGGVANMTKITQSQMKQTVAIIVGQKEEMNAVRECNKLGIKMIHIVDTNCNPSLADYIIPANDDARNSVKFILNKFLLRIRLAQTIGFRFQKRKIKKR